MSNNTKQSEDTYIRWSVNMEDAIRAGQFATEPVLTIHPDGRVTSSPRLKPDKISALVLDQIKTQWMDDIQCAKIRELEDRIKRLEDAGDGLLELCEAEVNQHHLADQIDARCKSWRKAKDAKP